jgi:hypothetical protein
MIAIGHQQDVATATANDDIARVHVVHVTASTWASTFEHHASEAEAASATARRFVLVEVGAAGVGR